MSAALLKPDWAVPGAVVRCIDAARRKVAAGAIISDFEQRHVDVKMIEVLEILTIREVLQYRSFGDAWAVRFKEFDRGIEIVRRRRAKSVLNVDRPFFLDRFVLVRDTDDGDEPAPATPRERALA